jgi:hypothetical protein
LPVPPSAHDRLKRRETHVNEPKRYELHLDGQLFRGQRELLLRVADLARRGRPYKPAPGDEALLEGLLNLTDEIADQAHDRHGIDCLLHDDEGDSRGAT